METIIERTLLFLKTRLSWPNLDSDSDSDSIPDSDHGEKS